MIVYVVIWRERHRGTSIEVFGDRDAAIERSEEIKESYRQDGNCPKDDRLHGQQIRNVYLTCESERVSVEQHEVK